MESTRGTEFCYGLPSGMAEVLKTKSGRNRKIGHTPTSKAPSALRKNGRRLRLYFSNKRLEQINYIANAAEANAPRILNCITGHSAGHFRWCGYSRALAVLLLLAKASESANPKVVGVKSNSAVSSFLDVYDNSNNAFNKYPLFQSEKSSAESAMLNQVFCSNKGNEQITGVRWVGLDTNRLTPDCIEVFFAEAGRLQEIREPRKLSGIARAIEKQAGWTASKVEQNSLGDQFEEALAIRAEVEAAQIEKAVTQTETSAVLHPGKPAGDQSELNDWDGFEVPQFVDLANRAALKSELNTLFLAHPVVSVAGLSDSGKSFLVASFLNNHSRFRNMGSVFWHEPDQSGGEPLEVLISRLEQSFRLKGRSLFERSKQLMRQIEINNQLLVIDDFQSVDLGSYAFLIEAASRLKAPTRLVLISQTNIGMIGDIPDLPRLDVAGYDRRELRHFFFEKGLSNLGTNVVDEFLEKTDGLPIAADWFAFMINGLKRSPEQLLAGKMVVSARLQSWFGEIEAFIGEPGSNLLRMLSLCDGPFNMGVVRTLCLRMGSGPFEELFETLQRAYLVQSYSPFRWRLHQLIVELCRHHISDEFKRLTHRSLGIYHRDNAQGVARRFSEEKALIWLAKACRHFEKAEDYVHWTRTIHRTIPKLKSHGYYRLIIHLLSREAKENPPKDLWLAYNCAHACLIIGWYEEGMAIIKPLVGQQIQNDPSLKVSVIRLYADLLDATGEPRLALDKLQELLSSPDAKLAQSRALAQVKTAVIRLLTKLQDYCQAEKLSAELFAESKDDMGRAVALTGWGIALKCMGRLGLADDKLGQAVNLFCGKDNRGYGWSLSHQAMCQRGLGNVDGASLMLLEALRVKADIEEASDEYLEFLRRAHPLFCERALTRMIESEIERTSTQIRTVGKAVRLEKLSD